MSRNSSEQREGKGARDTRPTYLIPFKTYGGHDPSQLRSEQRDASHRSHLDSPQLYQVNAALLHTRYMVLTTSKAGKSGHRYGN